MTSKLRLSILITFWALASMSDTTLAQSNSNKVLPFEISLSKTDHAVSMACEGCAWKELEFTVSESGRTITAAGLVEDIADIAENEMAIILRNTSGGLDLHGLHGTEWKDLSVIVGNNKAIRFNQDGLIE